MSTTLREITRVASALLILTALSGTAAAGLAEKRAAAAYQQDVYPKHEASLRELVGSDVAIDVSWDELAVDGAANLYTDGFSKVYFLPLEEALRSITADEIGKDALTAALKTITIRNSGKTEYAKEGITFTGGVLTIDLPPTVNIDQVESRTKLVKKVLESAL